VGCAEPTYHRIVVDAGIIAIYFLVGYRIAIFYIARTELHVNYYFSVMNFRTALSGE
jgi:hypothetical protein